MDHELGITGPQRMAVRIIGRTPGISPGELAVTMRVHPSTLTGIMKRLEEREFVSRVEDDEDGRSVHLKLTARGRSADQARSNTVEAAVRRALAQLEPEEIQAAERVLSCLVDELERESR
jgi:MarR family transcriptional regulator, organic hydroperoxide resistance regulator